MSDFRLKIMIVFGTRPEAIKMAPVIQELFRNENNFETRVCVTGQHRQMVDPLLQFFKIRPDYDLNIMQHNQTLEYVTAAVLQQFTDIIKKDQPDYLLVQGDTTTSMAAALAAYYQKVKIGHIEAGLRTWNKLHPYPEEVNRRIIDSLSDVYFAHTEWAKNNLISEGVSEEKIDVTGNTVIDALLQISKCDIDLADTGLCPVLNNGKKVILVTAHRRENFGGPFKNICSAIKEIAFELGEKAQIVYPVHLNPNVREVVYSLLGGISNVSLIEPLRYEQLVHVMKKSYLILTDSGGIQEEAPSLGKPVLVLRETTERPEAVKAGCVEIVGTLTSRIVKRSLRLFKDEAEYKKMSKSINPYGDGRAAKRIVARLLREKISR